jgi:Concanavalin A-like lectin/glucanases superfamily/Carboxypeptidase regulatory-like domain
LNNEKKNIYDVKGAIMRKLLTVLILMTGVLLFGATERGLTCRELAEPSNPTGGQATVWQGESIEVSQHLEEIDREGWELADSVNINTFLAAGEHISVEYSGILHEIAISEPSLEASGAVLDAIDRAPAWIRAELETTLLLLDEELQEFWANVINEVDDPIIDEVAFCIATASDVYLSSEWAYPELYIQNAQMIYEYDQELNYVEVIDYGNSVTDEDYYTTTRYWTKSSTGVVHQVEVPRDIYYWHIVHPKITDEIPAFIAPDIVESNGSHTTNIVGPEDGYFWRDFLYNYEDEDYPSLRNYLVQCEYANDFTTGYDSAIGACTKWLGQSLVFTSNFERPHQPVRIYRKHIGRCGEHADMRVAIGRIALVPTTSIVCFTVDHTWNEFWDEEWIHWDGGSINNPYMYENGWGSNFGSVIDVRSDGVMRSVTETYAPNYATLTVHALDNAGEPLDGARVLVGLRLNGQVTGDMVGWTDNMGEYEFPIGDGHEYWVQMSSSWGNVDYQMITENTVGGDEYEVQLQINNQIPQIEYTEIAIPEDDEADYKLVVEYEADDQVVFGNIVMDDTSEDTWFYNRQQQGAVNFFMCDLVQYFSYVSGLPYEAFNTISESDFGIFGFEMPNPALGSWYAVLDNGNNVINPQWVKGNVTLYRWEGTGGTGTLTGIVNDVATGGGIASAEVRAGAFSTETGADGSYELAVYPGIYTVVVDHPLYERVRYESIAVADGEQTILDGSLTDDPIAPLNVVVSGDDETVAVVNWDAPSSLMNRNLLGYKVYRLLDENEFLPEEWVELTSEPISETSYTDSEWLSLTAGEYRYAVVAYYSSYTSSFTISQILPLYMTAQVSINLMTNSGDSAGGAVVELRNLDGVNSPYNYEFIYPAEGSLVLDNVWKGNYQISIAMEYYGGLTIEEEILADIEFEFELIELLPGAGFAGVCNYYLSWNAVAQNRAFENYRIYLDGSTEPLGIVTEPGLDLAAAGVDAGEHSVEIVTVYSSGVSAGTVTEFEEGSSLDYELLAHFPFDSNFNDIESGWIGECSNIALEETPFGNGAVFNGGDFITVAANPELTESALHYTTLFWINADSLNSGWRGVIGRPGRNQCVWLNADADYLHHRFHTASGGTNDGAPNTPNGRFHWEEWNQVAIVNNGLVAKTYINGELLAMGALGSALVADSTDMYIGKSPDNPTAEGYLYGIVDEVRMWNRGLSDAELRELYLNEVEVLGSGTLSGMITDSVSGNGVGDVLVELGIYEALSETDGSFEIEVPGRTYDIRLSLADYLVQWEYDYLVQTGEVNELEFTFELTGDSENEIESAGLISISNYPNPLVSGSERNNGTTFRIRANQGIEAEVELGIYNIKGQKVWHNSLEVVSGLNEYYWNGRDIQGKSCSSGIYFYHLINAKIKKSGKLLILR